MYVCNAVTHACDVQPKIDNGLSGGAVAAIVICSILGVVGIAAAVWYFVKKSKAADGESMRSHDGHIEHGGSLIQ